MTTKRAVLTFLFLALSGCTGMWARARVTVEAEAGRGPKPAAAPAQASPIVAARALSVPAPRAGEVAPKTPVTDWLLAHGCNTTLWNVSIDPFVTGHGVFHYLTPLTPTIVQERYGQTGRVNGSAAGGEWCTGSWTVGDNTTVGCWTAYVGMPAGYVSTVQDQQDLGYVECRSTTACDYIRNGLGAGAACSGETPPPTNPDHCNTPGETCKGPCPTCPPPPPNPCPHPAAVPDDVRATLDVAYTWLPVSQTARRQRLKRAKAWLELVAAYCAKDAQ